MSETVKRLQKEIPGIRIAIIAHGDYCDSDVYVTKILDFTTDEKKLCSFVENVASTGNFISLSAHALKIVGGSYIYMYSKSINVQYSTV